MWEVFFIAIGLMMIFEGIFPFSFPNAWRETFQKLIRLEDSQIRIIGLTSMVIGLIILLLVN